MFKIQPMLGNYDIRTAQDGTTMFLIPAAPQEDTVKKSKSKQVKRAPKKAENKDNKKQHKKRPKNG